VMDVYKVLWPDGTDINTTSDGFLVGWRIASEHTSHCAICISDVICRVELQRLREALRSIEKDPALAIFSSAERVSLAVLGEWCCSSDGEIATASDEMWLRLSPGQLPEIPRIMSLQHPRSGQISPDCCQLISYPLLKRNQVLSQHPLPTSAMPSSQENEDGWAWGWAVDRGSTSTEMAAGQGQEKTEMDRLLHQINLAAELRVVLLSQLGLANTRPSVLQQVYLGCMTLLFRATDGVMRLVGYAVQKVLDIAMPFSGQSGRPLRLKDVSALARHCEGRISQLVHLPAHWSLSQNNTITPSRRHFAWMALCNGVALIVLDLLAGLIVRDFLISHADSLMQGVHQQNAAEVLHVDVLRGRITWLMGHPAGLKCNSLLADAIGQTILNMLAIWNIVTSILSPLEPWIVATIGTVFGVMGLTTICAAVSDILGLITVHIDLFYTVLLSVYANMLAVISSLWKLFCGKKKNLLRHRIDHCAYEIDQLLLGTLIFTVLVFLCPTVLAFYGFFALVRLLVFVTQALLLSSIDFFHHFPLYYLLLHLLDPLQLPGSISLGISIGGGSSVQSNCNFPVGSSQVFKLQSHGMGASAILRPYVAVMMKTCKQFSAPRLLKQLLCGYPIIVPTTSHLQAPRLVHWMAKS